MILESRTVPERTGQLVSSEHLSENAGDVRAEQVDFRLAFALYADCHCG